MSERRDFELSGIGESVDEAHSRRQSTSWSRLTHPRSTQTFPTIVSNASDTKAPYTVQESNSIPWRTGEGGGIFLKLRRRAQRRRRARQSAIRLRNRGSRAGSAETARSKSRSASFQWPSSWWINPREQ